MKTIKFTIQGLLDKNGNEVNIGNIISVVLPKKITGVNQLAVNAILYCTVSNGLMISIIDSNSSLAGRSFKFKPSWDFQLSGVN